MAHSKIGQSADDSTQLGRFKELARELGCNEDEDAFNRTLTMLAKAKPLPKHEPKKRGRKTP